MNTGNRGTKYLIRTIAVVSSYSSINNQSPIGRRSYFSDDTIGNFIIKVN